MAASGSSSTSSTCHCGKICYCGLGYGEGEHSSFRSRSLISWQHFPPSTSSRSRCDDSSMETAPVPSLPECISERGEEAEGETRTSVTSSTQYPINRSIAQLNAEHYLKIRYIHEFFNFLIGHLVCAEPDDPVQYLEEILDRCLHFRDSYGEEPLFVSRYHINSLYDTFDPYGKGFITKDQYSVAMDNIGITRGITPNNPNPPLNAAGNVGKEYFLNEAHRCLRENLRKMVRIPKDWEENRLSWQKVFLRKKSREIRVGTCSDEEQLGEYRSEAQSVSKYGVVKEVVCPASSPCSSRNGHEPEQLFLTG